MSNQLATRLGKIEDKLKPKRVMVAFEFRPGHEEEDFETQYQDYVAKGGDPDGFILRVEKIEKGIGVADGDFA